MMISVNCRVGWGVAGSWNLMESDGIWYRRRKWRAQFLFPAQSGSWDRLWAASSARVGSEKSQLSLNIEENSKKCFSNLSICSDELVERSFFTYIILLLSNVKLELNVAAGNKINDLICLCHSEDRWHWEKRQDLLVGTVLPATGWQCLTKKIKCLWRNKTHSLFSWHVFLWVCGFLKSEEEKNIILH